MSIASITSDPSLPRSGMPPSHPNRPNAAWAPGEVASPAVTVVTPFYDIGEVFEETAASVLGQTLQQFEWLIVNDASTDQTSLDILDSYRNRDPRIRVIDHQVNSGLSASRNTGFNLARTELVMQLDGDDLLEPTCLEKLAWFMTSRPDVSFAKGYTMAFGVDSYLWVNGFHRGEDFLESNWADSNSMVRRSVQQAVGGYDESNRGGLEDWDFWLKCANGGYWGDTVHEPLTWYRKKGNHTTDWPNWDSGENEAAFRRGLRERYASLWDDGFPHLTKDRFGHFEPTPTELPFPNVLEKRAKRLMMILPWMTMGGADRFNLDVVSQVTSRGWEVTIVATNAGSSNWEELFLAATDDVHVLPRFLRPADYPRYADYLVGSRRPDVVLLTNSEPGYHLLPYLRSRHRDVGVIDFVHAEQEDRKSGGFANLSNLYREQIDLTLCASDHVKRWMTTRGGDGTRIDVAHLGVDPDEWQPDPAVRAIERSDLGVDEHLPVILYAARIAEEKQPAVFAETMRLLDKAGHNFLALVAGDGPERQWLQSFVSNNHLAGRVRVLGEVSPRRIRRLMQAADVMFLPSKREGIALSLFEAMACELPIVAAHVGGQSELVSPECGVLVSRGDPAEEADLYAKTLADLLDSPDIRSAMGEAGRKRIQSHFTVQQMGDRLTAAFETLSEPGNRYAAAQVPPELAAAHSTLATDYARLEEVVAYLWERDLDKEDPDSTQRSDWRYRLYRKASVALNPIYRRLTDSQSPLATRLKDRFRESLNIQPVDVPWTTGDETDGPTS